MAAAFKFELVSPERLLVSEDVESVVLPGSEGEMTVMANHAPLMSTIKPGVVTVKTAAGSEQRYVVFGGFVDVLPESCTLLAESAVTAADFDKADLARRIEAAKADMESARDDESRTRFETLLSQLARLEDAV
jgi:F-type H+-transporting ATPase subunit epsilon